MEIQKQLKYVHANKLNNNECGCSRVIHYVGEWLEASPPHKWTPQDWVTEKLLQATDQEMEMKKKIEVTFVSKLCCFLQSKFKDISALDKCFSLKKEQEQGELIPS